MRVVTFGEIMLRLAPENYLRFVQADRLEATFGGAEANVAVSLANFGDDVSFVSKLPSHEIGQSAINSLRKFGVGTSLSQGAASESAFITAKRARANARAKSYTTGRAVQSQPQPTTTSTGTKFSTAQNGSTLRESRPRFPTRLQALS